MRITKEEIDTSELYAALSSADPTHCRGAIASFCGVVRREGLPLSEGPLSSTGQECSTGKASNGKEHPADGGVTFEPLTGSDEDFIATTRELILGAISALPSPSLSIVVVHRKGVVRPGHLTSLILICARHQEEALRALCLVSRTLKERMPIWKHSLAAGLQNGGA